jgi:hypothetical protein
MELALNLVWAIIATASYVLLFRHLAFRGDGHARGPSRSQCIIGLTCVLAILFPVVSLTDDLHEVQATVEDASLSGLVTKRCVTGHSSTPQRTLHQNLFIFVSFATGARWAILEGVAARRIDHPTPGMHLFALDRAPPSFAGTQTS